MKKYTLLLFILLCNHSPTFADINKIPFVTAVLQWRYEVSTKLDSLQRDYKEVTINVAEFRKYLYKRGDNDPFPINAAIYKEWGALFEQQDSLMKGEEVFGILLKNEGTTWNMMSDQEALEKHYKKCRNRKIYKGSTNNISEFKDGILPQISALIAAMDINPDDPNLPINREKAKQLYKEKLDNWLIRERKGFARVASNSPNDLLSCECLDVYSPLVTSNVIPDSVIISLLMTIKTYFQKQIGEQNDLAPWHDVASYGITVMGRFRNKHRKDWKNYTLEEVENLQFPTNIASWMWRCHKVTVKTE